MERLIKIPLARHNARIRAYWTEGNDWYFSHYITKTRDGKSCNFAIYKCREEPWDFWDSCEIGDVEERLVSCS